MAVSLKKGDNKTVVIRVENSVKEESVPDPEKVFDRFYKGDTSRHINSSGIGLSVAKKLVDSMGGEIKADLNGETFGVTMVLPSI